MARSFKNISSGMRLVPHDGTNIGNTGGDFEVITSDGKAYFYNGSEATNSALVTENHTATLTSKTLDGNDNTFLNIPESALTGPISVSKGGTGATTLTGYVKGSGTSPLTASSTIPRSDVAAASANYVVINDGSGNLSQEAVLSKSRGGTGLTSYTPGDMLIVDNSSDLVPLPIGTDGQVLGIVNSLPAWGAGGGGGGSALTVKNVSATYVVLAGDDVILCNGVSAGFTATIPAASGNSGKLYRFKKTDATFNTITITDAGSFTTTLNTKNESIDLISDGTSWTIYDRVIPSVNQNYSLVISASVTAPSNISPTIDNAFWYRQRNCAVIQYSFFGVADDAGTGNYTFSIPSGLTIATGNLGPSGEKGQSNLGPASGRFGFTGGSGSYVGYVQPYNTTNLQIQLLDSAPTTSGATTTSAVSSSFLNFGSGQQGYTFTATVPISGWND